MVLTKCRGHSGFTLHEVLIATTVLAIMTAIGAPLMIDIIHSLKLKSTAESIQADLKRAKSESAKRNSSISVTFQTASNQWCYGFSQHNPCDCNISSSCTVGGTEYRVHSTAHPGIALNSNVSGNRFSFQPLRGTVTAGNVELTGANGKTLRIVVSGMGRIRMCNLDGDTGLPGFPACNP